MARACEQQDVSSALNVNALGLNIYNRRGNRVHLDGVAGLREYYMAHRGKPNGKGKRDLINVDRVRINSTAWKHLRLLCALCIYQLD